MYQLRYRIRIVAYPGGFMKNFLHNYSYSSVKMFVNQFAISIMGAMLSMATVNTEDAIVIFVSIFAIAFYLFLIYTQAWELGAKDKISVDIGKKEYKPHTGLFVSLLANIPNFIIAITFVFVLKVFPMSEVAANIRTIASLFNMLLEGMYLGVLTTVNIGERTLLTFWWMYFVITVPAMLTSWLAYYLGHKNKKFTTLFDYQAPKAKKK